MAANSTRHIEPLLPETTVAATLLIPLKIVLNAVQRAANW